ncbi:MAG: flagellar M-ring protein FliF [Pontiellaceae bacterium]|nr:flagellar M-ring protein FliF [Pontiellaceae bacterium]MBN2784110.1 flagellar M-ring protein FliF [Pontiellaceae bacterium]
MRDSVNMLKKQVQEIWRQFGAPQRMSVITSLLVAIAVISGLIYWGSRPDFRLLYGSLSLEDAAQIREKLEDAKIPVRIGQSGTSISVPASELYTARLMLASAGLPKDSSTGFELFEQPKFGLTDFAQKVNYQRALQGELERTISSMQGIRSARVMLVLPKEHLFASEDERKAQASVLITLNGSGAVGSAQVQSIVHLLASSVQSLDPSQVTVSDQTGRLLTQSMSSDSVMQSGSEQLEVQERTEQRLVAKAQDILDRALGLGNSIVRVNVALDFSDQEQRNQTYDAESRVALSERIVSEDKSGGSSGGAGGAAGVTASVSVSDPSNMKVDNGGGKDKTEETYAEYVVPTTVTTIRQKGVRMDKLSVAVCIAQGESPRTPEQMKAISDLVASALGVDPSRSDTIQIAEMPFVAPQEPAKANWWEDLPVSYDSLFKGVGGIVALGFVFGASRKVKSALLASNPSIEVPINEAQEQEQERIMKEEPFELEDQLARVNEMARGNPKTVAAWISNAADWSA